MDGGDRVGHDLALRAAALAGDERACRAWYDAAFAEVRAYVHWRCGGLAGLADLADDAVQETWLTAVRRVAAFDPARGPFAGWVCGIAANVVRDLLRRRRRSAPLPADCPAPVAAAGRDRSERIALALAELPPRYEQALRAKYLDGHSVRAMAETWGETPKAVESLLTRARQAFRTAYEKSGAADG